MMHKAQTVIGFAIAHPNFQPFLEAESADEEGIAWYSSFGEQNLGRLDPKTGEVTQFPIPLHKPGFPTGLLGLRSDREGNLWLGNMYQGTIIKFDRKTKTFRFWPLPPEQNIDAAQVNW